MVKHLTNPLQGRPLPLGSLMSATAQRLGGQLDRALEQAGYAGVRAAHAQVFLAIDGDGTRISTLAERTHMTKQAMTEQVDRLARAGYLEVVPDPSDGRAKLVRLTKRGRDAVTAAAEVIDAFDRWLDDLIGEPKVRMMRATLVAILASDRSDWFNAQG